jgi:hypothetical protein
MIKIDGRSVSDLVGEVVLQRAPLAQNDTAIAAMDFGVLCRTFWDNHLDCPADFAVELMIKAHSAHQPIMRFSHGNASHSTTDSKMARRRSRGGGLFSL